ncbi:MAG: hypothetical protein GX786_06960 [Clostridiales bacterium]|nr:hypothetical protein [Clostridiales bacterium]
MKKETQRPQEKGTYSIIGILWLVGLVVMIGVLFFLKEKSPGDKIVLALVLLIGWSMLFLAIMQGLKRRNFQQILAKTNESIAFYHQSSDGEKTLEKLEEIKKMAKRPSEEQYIDYLIASILYQMQAYEKAAVVLETVPGFTEDPALQEEYLFLKTKVAEKKKEELLS